MHSYDEIVKLLDDSDKRHHAKVILEALSSKGNEMIDWQGMTDVQREAAKELIVLTHLAEAAVPEEEEVSVDRVSMSYELIYLEDFQKYSGQRHFVTKSTTQTAKQSQRRHWRDRKISSEPPSGHCGWTTKLLRCFQHNRRSLCHCQEGGEESHKNRCLQVSDLECP